MPTAGEFVKAVADPQTNDVATEETTTSTSYTNLATTGPAVTVALAAGQSCLILMSGHFFLDTSPAGARARISFAVSGAETIVAADGDSMFTSVAADYVPAYRAVLFTATTGGSYTFTLKYKIGGAVTGTFAQRRIIAMPLP